MSGLDDLAAGSRWHDREMVAPAEPIIPNCHNQPMKLIAESPSGRATAYKVALGRGIQIAIYRCGVCGREEFEGWLPPTWISAIARLSVTIKRELEEARREHDRPPGLERPA